MGVEQAFANASVLVAFLGGMVMLFAPCCVTLMLPAYLGTVFKSRSKVLLMTLIFAAGVATVILPMVLGARFLTSFFAANHTAVFAIGSLLMIGAGMMALFNKSLKVPFVSHLKAPQVTNATSAYVLGVVSGISSSCCAPVLMGALTLSAVSPTIVQAAVVGLAYTLGIVFPLLLLSLVFEKKLLGVGLRLQHKKISFAGMRVALSNLIAFWVLVTTGTVMLILALTNRLNMDLGMAGITVELKGYIDTLAAPFRELPYSDVWVGLALLGFVIYLVRLSRRAPQKGQA